MLWQVLSAHATWLTIDPIRTQQHPGQLGGRDVVSSSLDGLLFDGNESDIEEGEGEEEEEEEERKEGGEDPGCYGSGDVGGGGNGGKDGDGELLENRQRFCGECRTRDLRVTSG